MTSRPPHHRTCGSASGGSWQSRRIKQHSRLCPADAEPRLGRSASSPGSVQQRVVLSAKFSPSRVVRPPGVPGSLLSVLRPRLTPTLARWPLLTTAPAVSGGAEPQVSLSKDVNSCCAAGSFTSGVEHRTWLCGASLSAPSALYDLSVRRLISFD